MAPPLENTPHQNAGPVSRGRYERERRARLEAESFLEAKSRELYEANDALRKQAETLEEAVMQRTIDLECARAQAEEASAAKSIFLATMSHEIRTPLNGVLGMAEAMKQTDLTEAQRDMLAVVLESGRLLQTVLNDILDLSKIEAGKFDIEEVPFDLRQTVHSVEAMYALKAQEKGLELQVEFGRDAVGWVTGDPVRLRQILGNLISNAIKFTDRGSVYVRVEIAKRRDFHELHLVVEDTGRGISAVQQSRLFKPYEQIDSSISREHGGTGLGLSIARRFCQLMHGELSLKSCVGRGSAFSAVFRVSPTAAPQPVADRGLEAEFIAFLKTRKLRILAAEDNKTNQLVLCSLLKPFDITLDIVCDGSALVAQWRKLRPDIILMDVQMPKMNGLEATATIRQAEVKEGVDRTPIIALSANMMRHHEIEYRDIGMDACVPKPFQKAALLTAILSCMTNE